MRVITDKEFISELKRGPLGRDLEKNREKQRLADAKRLVKERDDLNAEYERVMPDLAKAEEAALAEFHEISARLEEAREKANASCFLKEESQKQFERRLASINGEILEHRNPIVHDLYSKLREIADDACNVTLISDVRGGTKISSAFSSYYQGAEIWTNRAARYVRRFHAFRISNTLHGLAMAGRDTDEALRRVFDAGVNALPGPEIMRLDDNMPTQFSPNYEHAVADFLTKLDMALEAAKNG